MSQEPQIKLSKYISEDFLIDFQDVVDDLFADERLDLIEHQVHHPASDVLVSILEDSLGLAIPGELLSLYTAHTDGLELVWEFEADSDMADDAPVVGRIEVVDAAKLFGSWLDELWGAGDGLTAEQEDFSWELRGLEPPAIPGSGYRTVVHVPEYSPEYTLYFHEPGGQTHKLSVGFVEYIECALETRGFLGWQFLVSDVDFADNTLASERAREFHRWMPQLFEDVDLSRYRTVEP